MVDSMPSDIAAVEGQEYSASLDDIRDFFAASQQRIILEQAVEHHAGTALKSCTYSQGYIQQPLFSCLTCRGGAGEEGSGRDVALCAACAFKCHSQHELEEIYEKRHTRCDCPTLTSRLPPAPTATATPTSASLDQPARPLCCTFNPSDVSYPINDENTYNHNYVGLYCHCNGSYEAGQEVMYQCSLCFDWYHERCMRLEAGQTVPDDGEEGLFMCRTCLTNDKHTFLLPYLLKARQHRRRTDSGEVKGEEKEVDVTRASANDVVQIDLFPDITAKQTQQAKATAATATPPTSTATSTPLSDTLPGWQCMYCHYFNQPQQDECFGCEKQKKVELPTTTLAIQSAASVTSPVAVSTLAANCSRFTHIPASFSRSSPPDLWVHSSWQSALCMCDDCPTLHRTRAPFLVTSDSDGSDEEEEVDGEENGDVRSAEDVMDGYLSSLPRHALLEGMGAMSEWNDAVMRRLQALGEQVDEHGEAVLITGEMVQAVAREAKEEVEATRRRRRDAVDDLEGADGDGANSTKRGRFEE